MKRGPDDRALVLSSTDTFALEWQAKVYWEADRGMADILSRRMKALLVGVLVWTEV